MIGIDSLKSNDIGQKSLTHRYHRQEVLTDFEKHQMLLHLRCKLMNHYKKQRIKKLQTDIKEEITKRMKRNK